MSASPDGQTPLDNLGVIRAEGPDAAQFLHNQLTQDVLQLGPDQGHLAAWCSAKGRVLASLIVLRPQPEEVLLLCPRDLLAPTLRRLTMFVLRAKVKLSDASAVWRVHGLLGPAIARIAGQAPAPWQCLRSGAAAVVGLPPDGAIARALWLAPVDTAAPDAPALADGAWALSEVRSGVVLIGSAVAEAFVPQMLNYESVGGVNFKKGCYPGQEVVARSQFRGTLKRRAFLVEGSEPLAAGDALFTPADLEQPCATVVQAAQRPEGGWIALVSGQVGAITEPLLRHRGPDGQTLQPRPVPYPLLDDI